jgi:hypothetical protein
VTVAYELQGCNVLGYLKDEFLVQRPYNQLAYLYVLIYLYYIFANLLYIHFVPYHNIGLDFGELDIVIDSI